MQNLKKLIFIVIYAIVTINLYSIPDNMGKKFYIAFPSNYYPDAEKKLFITSDVNTSVNVYIPSPLFNNNFSVIAGQTTIVSLPQNSELKVSDSLSYTTIRITANDDVTVYGINQRLTVTDAFLAIPVDALGTEYIVQSYPSSLTENPTTGGSQFAIVGTVDGTSVTVTLPINVSPYAAGVPYTFNLNTGQAYYLKATGLPDNDLSGTFISANYPVAVFGSHQCANVPVSEIYCDYLIEQLPPITTWGKEFVIVPLAGRKNGDTYRFLASENNTDIYLDGMKIASLNKGQIQEIIIDGPGYVTSSDRILVTQYANGESYDNPVNDIGDPFMMIVPPVEQYLSSYTVYSPDIGTPITPTSNYINIIVNKLDKNNVTVDATPVPAASFTDLINCNFSVARASVNTGTHTITGTLPLCVLVYGFNWRESYGYPGGSGFIDFVSTPTPTITQTVTATITKTMTITKTATITKTPTQTLTQTYGFTFTITPTQTVKETETVTATITITLTASMTQTLTQTNTISPTFTFTLTLTDSVTLTFTPTITITPTKTITKTITETLTATLTGTITETATVTSTLPPLTATPTVSPTEPELILDLIGSFPDPFKENVRIVYYLSKEATITIKIFTISGEVVVEYGNLKGVYGNNEFLWDGLNKSKRKVASGVFIFKIKANDGNGNQIFKWGKLACVR